MPTRPTWTGSIQISLVSIGVKIFPATNSGRQVEFHQIDRKTHKRVHHRECRRGGRSRKSGYRQRLRVCQRQIHRDRSRGAESASSSDCDHNADPPIYQGGILAAGAGSPFAKLVPMIAEGLRANFCSSADTARKLIEQDPPSLAIIDHAIAHDNATAVLEVLRSTKGGELPVVMVAAREHEEKGITDWLTTPFTDSYARTKIRAWVLRESCRWIRAPIPENEPARLTSLRALDLLDTEPEERFDRITRVATALFNVPMATITLVDERRQWFKSCQGTAGREDPRDASFCAHVVSNREPMIVVDTLSDERFADNPLVLGGPRIRFYAGYPLTLDDGSCIGTLCLLDTRPRTLKEPDLEQLRDLALIVMGQFQALKVERAQRSRQV